MRFESGKMIWLFVGWRKLDRQQMSISHLGNEKWQQLSFNNLKYRKKMRNKSTNMQMKAIWNSFNIVELFLTGHFQWSRNEKEEKKKLSND